MMTEESSGSFSAFWQKSVDKVSFKSVKFMPNTTKPGTGKTARSNTGNEDGGESSNLTQKQRRRAQVRKAQIEHRQRKENYVKHLEQDVINLREAIAQAETESVLFKHENEAIKSTLQNANVLVPPSAPLAADNLLLQENFDFMDFATFQGEPHQRELSSSVTPPEWPSTANQPHDMLISNTFDELVDSTVLQISPTHSHSSGQRTGVPTTGPETRTDIYNFPNAFATPQFSSPPSTSTINANQAALANLKLDSSLAKPLPQLPSQGPGQVPRVATYSDLSTLAINFILALEHPCRTHFHPPNTPFIPTDPPSGHELMASTLLFTTAPPSAFSLTDQKPLENATWTTPSTSLELRQLHAMSKSLPKGDWEITPVQAWFILMERYSVRDLMGVLENLKAGLGKLVTCFHFGAVMDEARFWEVVVQELGVPRTVNAVNAANAGNENVKGKERENEVQ